jgi:hypothetical protein
MTSMNWEKVAFGLREAARKCLSEAFDDPAKRSVQGVGAALAANIVLEGLARAIEFGATDDDPE